MNVEVSSAPTLRDKARKFLLDPYLGINGAICHVKGRDDFLTTFLYELPPGGAQPRQR